MNLKNLMVKFFAVISIFKKGNFLLFYRKIKEYVFYNFIEKWQFVYFESDLSCNYKFPKSFSKDTKIILASKDDVEKIQHDIFPYMSELAISDKREILEIGKKDMLCFLAERGNKFVHYTLIYTNIFNSPLMQTPFDQSSLSSQHVYLSSAYTVDSERGSWIHLQALSYILEYLKTKTVFKKTINLVHPSVIGSINYFNRLGFKIISGPRPPVYVRFLFYLIGYKNS